MYIIEVFEKGGALVPRWKVFLIVALVVILGVSLFMLLELNIISLNNDVNVNSIVDYAKSKHLPSVIIAELEKLNVSDLSSNSTDYYNAKAIVDELVCLGDFVESPLVLQVLEGIVSDGRVSTAEALWW